MEPARGFSLSEYAARLESLQRRMHEKQFDAVLLASEHEIRYFSGFHSQFWQSLTRSWYLLIPSDGQPVAVIPSIGVAGMENLGVARVSSWSSPQPADEGLSLLVSEVEKIPRRHGNLGLMLGAESHWRVAQGDIERLQQALSGWNWQDVAADIWAQRWVKSPDEIAKIRYVADLASKVKHDFARHVRLGMDEHTIVRLLRQKLLEDGVDNVPFLIAGAGQGGYADIIMGPSDYVPKLGDVLILDTGAQFDGYFCDFDRNYAFGQTTAAAREAQLRLWQVTENVLKAIRPNMRCDEVFALMNDALAPFAAGAGGIGRMGHGLGMGLTEWPSIHPDYRTPLSIGAVLTLEPALMYAEGKMLVHEENIVITEAGAELLTNRAPQEFLLVE